MKEEKEQTQIPGIRPFTPHLHHAHTHQDDSCFHIHNSAEILHQRLDSLNNLVKKRSSFSIDRVASISEEIEKNQFLHQNAASGEIGNEDDNITSNLHNLAHKDPKSVPETDASKRLEQIFETYMLEKNKDNLNTTTKKSKKRKGLNRIQVKRGERRKRSIQALQNQLKKTSSKHLSRSANSLRFHLRAKQSDNKETAVDDEFPIPVSESEMDPHLLLTLSCEKLAIDRGRRLLKEVVLHMISQKLFVLMYWFVHCRFFQVSFYWHWFVHAALSNTHSDKT